MNQLQILIIEGGKSLYHLIRERMAATGIDTHYVEQLSMAIPQFIQQEYILVLVDVRTFDQVHVELVRQIQQIKPTSILALSSSLSTEEKLCLLQSGVNAFVEEPFNIDICVAQTYALIHTNSRNNVGKGTIIHGTDLIINRYYRQALVNGKPLTLTRKEFDLLYCFAAHPGQIYSCEQLYRQVWNVNIMQGSNDTVKSHIKTLRKKIASAGKFYIQNVWEIGYKFVLTSDKSRLAVEC